MHYLTLSLFALALLFSAPALAVMEDYPSVKLQGLDKSVGRTVTFEAKVGSTIQYGPLFIKIHACRKAPPIEKPESAAFLQIWEVPPGQEKSEWVFSGWMFASSPALSAMDHPVYDIWVLDCLGKEEPNEEAAAAETEKEADQSTLAPADDAGATTEQTPATQAESIPTDSEAEAEPQQAPVDIPVDAEAEEQAPTPTQSTGQAPVDPVVIPQEQAPAQPEGAPPLNNNTYPYDPDAAYVPPAPSGTRPVDPTRDPTTAYDFMKRQGGTNAAPPAQIQPSPVVP